MIRFQEFEKDEIIIKENEFGNDVYIIKDGKVQVSKINNGKEFVIGTLSKGEIFGEMTIIDEKPRSATIKALEKTKLRVFKRNEFLKILQEDQEVFITILSSLFNRLREANVKILQLEEKSPSDESRIYRSVDDNYTDIEVTLEGLTEKAKNALPENPYRINQFPFVVGRVTKDPFAHQNLALSDSPPFQISRHHFSVIKGENKAGIIDLGSTCGTKVGDNRIGGKEKTPGPVYIESYDETLTAGENNSEFVYKISVVKS